MNYKIIETEPQFPDLLLYRDRDETGQEMVMILTIGTMENSDDMFAGEKVLFENSESAKSFIQDYSVFTANKFCKDQGIKF